MTKLQAMIHETHPYVLLYHGAHNIMANTPEHQRHNVRVALHADKIKDGRRHNLPTDIDEIGAVLPGDCSEEVSEHRDVVLHLQGDGLQCISHLNPAYSP